MSDPDATVSLSPPEWRLSHRKMGGVSTQEVLMARLVKELTGPNETGRWGAAATDLGYPAITNHGYTITVFGDTFVDRVGGDRLAFACWFPAVQSRY